MSARKGHRVEREIARRLRALGLAARRVPLSGAAAAVGRDFGGDVRLHIANETLVCEVKARVPTSKREAWINKHVIDQGVRVLLVNPNAVRTGLNNLVAFSTAIWHELDYSATTYRQANGRLHRIGQTRPVSIHMPFVAETIQETAVELVAKKVTASLQVDGLDVRAALEAAGAGTDSSLDVALSIGQLVYDQLTAA